MAGGAELRTQGLQGHVAENFREAQQGDLEHMLARVREECIISPCPHSQPMAHLSSYIKPRIPQKVLAARDMVRAILERYRHRPKQATGSP